MLFWMGAVLSSEVVQRLAFSALEDRESRLRSGTRRSIAVSSPHVGKASSVRDGRERMEHRKLGETLAKSKSDAEKPGGKKNQGSRFGRDAAGRHAYIAALECADGFSVFEQD